MRGIGRENIDRWFYNNLDVDNRTLYVGSTTTDTEGGESGVDYEMAEYLIKGLHVLESKSDKPITIIMNNPGGDWYHGMAMYDAIKNSPTEITIKVYGQVMSMGTIILQSATKRILQPNSRFMIHYGYNGFFGHSKSFERWGEENKRMAHVMENIYLDKIMEKDKTWGIKHMVEAFQLILNKVSDTPTEGLVFSRKGETRKEEYRKILKDLLNFDTILTPEETISIGLGDEIYSKY